MSVPEEPADVEMADAPQDEEPIEAMVKTRARRSNAGNRMRKLIEQEESEQVVVNEDDEIAAAWKETADDEDFGGREAEDAGDVSLESSSDEDEDEGAQDEEAGEKELQKAQRADKRRKRKLGAMEQAKARVAKKPKLIKTASTAGTTSSTPQPAPRPKKKSERVSWLPTEIIEPIRTSKRGATMESRKELQERLQEKERHRLKTVAIMEAAEKRKDSKKVEPLTQAQKLEEAKKIEELNSKSLNHWEETEKKRQEEQRRKLLELKGKKIQGPVIAWWSGRGIWVDGRLKYTGKGKTIEEVEHMYNGPKKENLIPPTPTAPTIAPTPALPSLQTSIQPPPVNTTQIKSTTPTAQPPEQPRLPSAYPNTILFAPPETSMGFLAGIEEYASQSPQPPPTQPQPQQQPYPRPQITPHYPLELQQLRATVPRLPLNQARMPGYPAPPLAQQTNHQPYIPGSLTPQLARNLPLQNQQTAPPPPLPPQKVTIEQSTRNTITLREFPATALPSSAPAGRGAAALSATIAAREALSRILFAWESNSSSDRDRKAPNKPLCAIKGEVARYRDPVTGLPYADLEAFRMIRRLLGGGMRWSTLLGGYVGRDVHEEPKKMELKRTESAPGLVEVKSEGTPVVGVVAASPAVPTPTPTPVVTQ